MFHLNRILIIKHGSLGDIVFSLPAMYSVYTFYKGVSIDILTEKKYFNFLNKTNYFNNFLQDNRSSNIFYSFSLLINLLKNKYDLIIDLQNSKRTSYYHLFFRIFSNTKISSSRRFANFRYLIPIQGTETATEGLFNQIKLMGIPKVNKVEYDWLQCNINLDNKYKNKTILFIPGVSKKGKYKQWDPLKFGELAKYCVNKKYQICVVGTQQDRKSILPILNNCPNLINNIDNSPPHIIYSISKIASLTITNDTGPGHIASLSGSNILWLVNNNKITRANISNNKNNYKISSSNVKDISTKSVIQFIEDNKLL